LYLIAAIVFFAYTTGQKDLMLLYIILSLCTDLLVACDNTIKKNSFDLPSRAVTHVIDLTYVQNKPISEQSRIALSPTPHSRCSSPISSSTDKTEHAIITPSANSLTRYSEQSIAAAQLLLSIKDQHYYDRFIERVNSFFASGKASALNNEGALASLFDTYLLDGNKKLQCDLTIIQQALWYTCTHTKHISCNNRAAQTKLIRLLNKAVKHEIDFLGYKDTSGNTILESAIAQKNYLLIEACLQFNRNVQALGQNTITTYSKKYLDSLRDAAADQTIIALLEKNYHASYAFVSHYQKSQNK
jgi:hypothetical protein